MHVFLHENPIPVCMLESQEEENENEETSNESDSDIDWLQHLALIVGGELPCSKEEAAILAAISMRLDDAWPHAQAQARMSAQAATAQGQGGDAAGGGGGGNGQVCLSVTAPNEQHEEGAGHVLALDESDGEREHERMLNEFLNKHRKADRSLVRFSSSSLRSVLSILMFSNNQIRSDMCSCSPHCMQVRAGTFYQTVTKQDSLPRREVHSVTSSFRSGQVPVHVQVRPPPVQRAEAGGGGGDGGGTGGGVGGGTSAGGRFLRGLGPCMRDQDEDEDYAHRLRAMLARYLPHDLVHSKRIDDLIRVRRHYTTRSYLNIFANLFTNMRNLPYY